YLRKDTIWAGTDDGLVWITRDGGKHWQNVTPRGLTPWSKVAQIDASHFDDDTAYIAVNRFRLDDLRPHIYRTHDRGRHWQGISNGLPGDASVNTVREDPVRKGLLFAGTERTVYASFDDGAHWQSLQLNLPSTSIRDLVVHGNDLVIGTHGRSFWILDDLTPLRQLKELTQTQTQLFVPQTAFRIRRDTYSDTPLPPEEPVGQNPPNGAIFDYSLAATTSGTVTLAIYDRSGKLVRRFSSVDRLKSIDQKDINVPIYWAREPVTLANTPGPHRFVWDLHGPTPHSLFADFPISAIVHETPLEPLGVLVTPGRYTVRLTVGGQMRSAPLVIEMDPRVHISQAGLRAQFDLAGRIADGMNRTFNALQKHKSPSLARLNGALTGLYAEVEGADAPPTLQQHEQYERLERALQKAP
ncbi:MAG: glycoside hydrolase, partial [Candidatus Baltobacteraceae bacterium]